MKKNKGASFRIIALIFGVYCFICLILIPVGTLLSRQESGAWGDIFSLGQFLADLCLIPLAIVGFYLTLSEIRKTQEFADLCIGWDISNNLEKIYNIDKPESRMYHSNQISLANNGTAPSALYQITLEIPAEYGHIEVKNSSGDWRGGLEGDRQKFNFIGTSYLTSFPNASQINLGKIHFYDLNKLPSTVSINYFIACDKGEYKKGNLEIKFNTPKSSENKK